MSAIFGIIATPFGYVMQFMYDFIGNYGLCIILFSLLVKLATTPLLLKQKKSMLATQRLQPKIQAIQKKYYNDKNRMNEEMQALYDRENVSPTSGCGTMLITMLILLGLYQVILQPMHFFMHLSNNQINLVIDALKNIIPGYVYDPAARGAEIQLASLVADNFDALKAALPNLSLMQIDFNFLGIDLSAVPEFGWNTGLIIPALSGLTAFGASFLQSKMQERVNPDAPVPKTGFMMYVVMPAMSLYFCFILPAGLGIYWIANNIFGAASEPLFNYIIKKQKEKESVKS